MTNGVIRIRLPDWLDRPAWKTEAAIPDVEERMRFAIRLSAENVERETGGPFGAAVFDESGVLVAAGVNLVAPANCSILHAEIVAIALAQQKVGRFDLSDGGRLRYELVASTEPCAMCYGALHWSGARRLVCGARKEDAERVGFDEGPKPADWIGELSARGIETERDVLRAEAAAVLRRYAKEGGVLYNANPRL